jgi:glycosyltransferase involved in cell wall biosynthesis
MLPPNPSVAVVVSELNAIRTIRGCLERIVHQDYPRDRFSVILVDAGSTDGTLAVAREFESQGVRVEVRQGCPEPEGQRIGVELTSSDIILFTNSDIFVPPDWISRHVAWHRRGYQLVGGSVFWGGDKYSFAWNAVRAHHPTFQIEEGAGIGFCNCSVDRKIYDAAGGIRDLGSQHDAEFAFRIVRSGGRLALDPAIEIYHNHPQHSLSLVLRRSFGYAYNHMLLVKAFYGRLTPVEGMAIRIDFPAQVTNILGLQSRQAYRERHTEAEGWGIRMGFLEFLFVRQCVRYPGHYLGLLAGFLSPSPSFDDIRDLHRQGPKA